MRWTQYLCFVLFLYRKFFNSNASLYYFIFKSISFLQVNHFHQSTQLWSRGESVKIDETVLKFQEKFDKITETSDEIFEKFLVKYYLQNFQVKYF